MDPYNNQRDRGDQPNSRRNYGQLYENTSGTPGGEQPPGDNNNNNPQRDAPDGGNPPATDRQPRYVGGFTVIPPNESRRRENQMIAQRDEETFQRWREANRPPAVHLNPERLGGNATEAGARERQSRELKCSKLQKKLKKEEDDRRRRQEEEAEFQKKKDEARQQAERNEEKRRQEEQRRREQFMPDHVRKTESFLQRFERTASAPLACNSATHTSSRSGPRSERDVELDRRRVNANFLDKLEREKKERETAKEGGAQGPSGPSVAPEDLTQQLLVPLANPTPDPEHSDSDWTASAEPEPDFDWALMKLMNSFPDFSKEFLEEILDQCSGDYQQAYTLLDCTLN
ncbi:epithelial-stromal interaction protein 1 [Centropristis striata]|uniref:epithelial-stromal interaction protein 1 n=1 Tax=Centropristis striata TaxID=184440 RepID=UPI0027DFD56C|nr:epithelial-stromal interaction protein 1 [Centropristis striata]